MVRTVNVYNLTKASQAVGVKFRAVVGRVYSPYAENEWHNHRMYVESALDT